METPVIYMIGFQIVVWSAIAITLVVLVARRMRIRNRETFEKRDN